MSSAALHAQDRQLSDRMKKSCPGAQFTIQMVKTIKDALTDSSMSWQDVVATRVYMLDTTRWEDAARAHAEIVTECRPALSFIGVANFFDPEILVEVEITAYHDDI